MVRYDSKFLCDIPVNLVLWTPNVDRRFDELLIEYDKL